MKELHEWVTFNRIGRQAFGRYWVSRGLPDIYLMEEMGIPLKSTIQLACRPTKQQRAITMKRLREEDNRNSRLSLIKELIKDLSKNEKYQLLAEVIG